MSFDFNLEEIVKKLYNIVNIIFMTNLDFFKLYYI